MFFVCFLLGAVSNINAQEQTPNDSLSIDKMLHGLPEVMVKGVRPIVKAERGKLSYNMPLLMKQLPADNAYEALTRIPGVSDADGSMKFAGKEVTLIINGQPTTLTQEQVAERLKAMPAAQLAKAEVMLAAPPRLHVRGAAINIVTKDYAGTNQLSGQIRGGLRQSKYSKGFGEGFLPCKGGSSGWTRSIRSLTAIHTDSSRTRPGTHWGMSVPIITTRSCGKTSAYPTTTASA